MSRNKKCPDKSNFLVYTKPQGDEADKHGKHKKCRKTATYEATISRVPPKVIKICTGAEMKKMCPPPCDCPKIIKAANKNGGLLGFLLFSLKVAIAAGVVYVSYDLGIWGTTEDTQNLYRKYCAAKSEPRKKNDKWESPSCEAQQDLFAAKVLRPYEHCDNPPFDSEKSYYKFQNKWNSGVQTVFGAIAGFPYNIINWSRRKEVVNDQLKCVPYSDLPESEKIVSSYK
ncbi:uncharacterized protein LOC114339721 isoform X1 [Diabrotica virgifera virgifera]|uniref:MICOS complex subunit MIC13 n=1 Tax=Diabrotica virgifera virgifera TaxID=50390 RepID=A0ABM5IX00_DIAVI|nr:uncharacterized protein LOC114339721 isoform X1 [Diabrotica virgifera virgifera]